MLKGTKDNSMAYEKTWKDDKDSLNSVELLKLKQNPLDIIETVFSTYDSRHNLTVSEDDKILLKWVGVYEHKPKNGSYMLRIRVTSGMLSVTQIRGIAEIADVFGKGYVRITTRGAIQLYNIRIERLPEIFKKLDSLGLSSYESCGDCPRTIIGNPLAGIDKDELFDTTEVVTTLNKFLLLNEDFSNLPRKLKISISASTRNPGNSEINDISFTPAIRLIKGIETRGFHLKAGGGLSSKPMMAQELPVFVLPGQVIVVVTAIATIFRDMGYRKSRNHSRLKFLVEDMGIEKFTNELISRTGNLLPRGIDKTESWNGSYYYGIHNQKQAGFQYLGLHIPLGEIGSSQLKEFANISETYGDGVLRTTSSQNLIISGIASKTINNVIALPLFKAFPPFPNTFLASSMVCTGSSFCNFAMADTQSMAREIAQHIDSLYNKDLPIRINITGCPNSCGHLHVADIGIQATFIKTDQGNTEAFDIYLGGMLGPSAQFAKKTKSRIPRIAAIQYVKNIIEVYQKKRDKDEHFAEFLARYDPANFTS